jgi:hypothetical protein
MLATAVTQAKTVTPAASNIKDDSNIMTSHNSRTQATAGMKAISRFGTFKSRVCSVHLKYNSLINR